MCNAFHAKRWHFWWNLQNSNEIENDTCQIEDNMKSMLIEVKTSEIDSHTHESDTSKSEGA